MNHPNEDVEYLTKIGFKSKNGIYKLDVFNYSGQTIHLSLTFCADYTWFCSTNLAHIKVPNKIKVGELDKDIPVFLKCVRTIQAKLSKQHLDSLCSLVDGMKRSDQLLRKSLN